MGNKEGSKAQALYEILEIDLPTKKRRIGIEADGKHEYCSTSQDRMGDEPTKYKYVAFTSNKNIYGNNHILAGDFKSHGLLFLEKYTANMKIIRTRYVLSDL